MYCSDSLEYTIRCIVIVVAVATDVIIIKGCRFSVRADTTYVVSLVAYVVEGFVVYVVLNL